MSDRDLINVNAETACQIRDNIYLFGSAVNMLYQYNKKTEQTKLLGGIPGRLLSDSKLVGKILSWKTKLILLPLRENKIWMFDLITEEWSGIEIRASEGEFCSVKFYQGFIHQNKVHMIGCYYPAIVRLDLNTMHLEYDTRMYEEIDKNKHNNIYFRTEYVRTGNVIEMGCCAVDAIFYYNLDDYSYKLVRVGEKADDFEGIALIGRKRFMFGRSKRMLYQVDETLNCYGFIKMQDCHYIATIRQDEKFVFLSNQIGKSFKWSEEEGFSEFNETCNFCEKQDEDNYIYLNDAGKLVESTDGVIREYFCKFQRSELEKYISERDILWNESNSCDLQFFLNVV